MFCNYCGSSNPDDARYCSTCGRTITGKPVSQQPEKPSTKSTTIQAVPVEKQESALPSPAETKALKRKVRLNQIRVWIAVSGVIVFLFAAGLLGTKTREGRYTNSAAGAVLILSIWTVVARRRLTRLQAEYFAFEEALGNYEIRRKAKFRKHLLTVLAIFLGVLAFGAGVQRAQRSWLVRTWMQKLPEIQAENARFRARLAHILQRETPTWDDYVQQTLEIEALLNEAEPIVVRAEQVLNQAESMFGSDPSVELLRRTHVLDRQYIELLRDEIAHAKRLAALPPTKQDAYYAEFIRPIQHEQERLLEEYSKLIRKLESEGVKLPSDVVDALNP